MRKYNIIVEKYKAATVVFSGVGIDIVSVLPHTTVIIHTDPYLYIHTFAKRVLLPAIKQQATHI